jgi:hypothetical protein
MAATGKRDMKRLSDDDLVHMSELMKGSDTVELKLTVPEADQRTTLAALEVDPLEAQIRQVFFFDTPDLALNRQGVVVRARRVQNKGDDSVVKLRPIIPADLAAEIRTSPFFGVEVDAMPGGYVCSGSMKGVPRADVRTTLAGEGKLRGLFTKEQRRFYAAHAPEGLALDDLVTLGPIFVLKLKFAPKGFERKMVAELWLYPDDSKILELSTKCAPGEAFQVANEARAFLTQRGVDLSGEQETKTKKALEFFTKRTKTPAVRQAKAAQTESPG